MSMTRMTVPTGMTVAESAALLGVTPRQVQRLASSGALEATVAPGGALLLDGPSVLALSQLRAGSGRPWSPEVAWGALWMLSGLDAPWLKPHQVSRLRARLDDADAPRIVNATRRRATIEQFRVSPRVLPSLRGEVARTGVSASAWEDATLNEPELEGYVTETGLGNLTVSFPMVHERGGNVTLRISESATRRIGDEMPEAVVAVDLASSSRRRERSVGLVMLDDLLPRVKRRTWVTAAEAAAAIVEELTRGDEDFALRVVARAVTDLRSLEDPADIARFLVEPGGTGDPRWDTLLATAIGRECRLRGVDAPSWTQPPALRSWWFPLLPDPILTARTMARTPIDFSTRGIWLDANALETV